MLRRISINTIRRLSTGRCARFCSGAAADGPPPTIGIDLGTTTTYVGIWEGGKPRILENSEGHRVTPSIVAKKGEEWLVGIPAKRQRVTNPKNSFSAVKRFIGRKFSEENVQADMKNVTFKVVAHGNGDAWLETTDGKQYPPQQLSAMILEKCKAAAEDHFGKEVKDAVITVPAYFDEVQRSATKEAGAIAGLNVLRILNEPTAAALAYGLRQGEEGGATKKVAVYDLGGGTFDISILEIGGGLLEVLATNGDTHLGGEDFDHTLIKYVLDTFHHENGVDVTNDAMAMQRVKEKAEEAKIELSSALSTVISLPYFASVDDGALNLEQEISRAVLENLCHDLIQKTLEPCRKALEDAKLEVSDIDEVLLVGGMTRMPAITETVKEFFRRDPSRTVNPDEAVAMGATAQAGTLSGECQGNVLLDVIPISVGIETSGGTFSRLVDRGTHIPVERTATYSTVSDGQTTVGISVYQGERDIAKYNKRLGYFELTNIPPASAGVPKIEVTFKIDQNSIMMITARDKATGKDATITLKKEGMEPAEIERILEDAAKNRETDRRKKETVDVKNEIDRLVNAFEDDVKGLTLVPEEHLSSLRKAMEELKGLRHNPEIEATELETKRKSVSDLLVQCGDIQYKAHEQQKATEAQQQTQEQTPPKEEGEKKEEKKE